MYKTLLLKMSHIHINFLILDSNVGVFQIFKNSFFEEHLRMAFEEHLRKAVSTKS